RSPSHAQPHIDQAFRKDFSRAGPDLSCGRSYYGLCPSQEMKVRSYWIKLAAGLAIVVLLFLFKVNLAKTGAEIRNSIPQWILLAGALHIIGLLLSAYRWQILLAAQHIEAPFWDLLKSYLIGGFFNNFLPTRVGGDVYRLIDSKRYSGSLLRPAAVIV